MQTSADVVALMTTEAGRLVIMIFFYFLAIKPIKSDVHNMSEKINKIFVRLAESENLKSKIADVKTDMNKFEERLHAVEMQQRICPVIKPS